MTTSISPLHQNQNWGPQFDVGAADQALSQLRSYEYVRLVITRSPFRKSSLNNKLEKKQALDAAKQVLTMLQSTKNVTPATIDSPTVPRSLPPLRMNRLVSMMPVINAHMNGPDQETTGVHLGRSDSESATIEPGPADTMHQHEEIGLANERSFAPQTPTTTRHIRRSTDPEIGALRTRLGRTGQSEIDEHHNDEDGPSQSYLGNGQVEPRQRISRAGARLGLFGETSELQALERLVEGSGRSGEGSGRGTGERGDRRLVGPPSYRTTQSISARSRRTGNYLPT